MQIVIKASRLQIYFCLGKVYDINMDGWSRQGFTVAWLGKRRHIFSKTWAA
jgi:hypothetical protein